MSHSYVKIWIHAIWSTKYRQNLIGSEIEEKVYDHITKQLNEQNCIVSIVNRLPDHIHCLFMLDRQKSIAEVIKQTKGSTSHFINQNDLTLKKFAWQAGYASFSVSESGVKKVYQYIKNQKRHHKGKSFQDEYEALLMVYGLDDN